jgi:diadenosine tetraphosphate (Ap4A) HIT family hydrolase
MSNIYETENFIVEAVDQPHVTRSEGGHIKIYPKVRRVDRTELSSKEAIEVMRLSMITGKAMTDVMNRRGVDIGRINYQDNGNWSVFKPEGPYFHIHLYGRAKSAKIQKWGDATYFPQRETGFYEGYESLSAGDVEEIRSEMDKIFQEPKYSDEQWKL